MVHNHVLVFTSIEHSQVITSALRHMRVVGGIPIYAYVIMPDHLHLLTGVPSPEILQKALSSFRRFTAKNLVEVLELNRRGWALDRLRVHVQDARDVEFWRGGYIPKDASDEAIFNQKLHYIHDNPVRCGYVREPAAWRFSSASSYEPSNLPAELEVDICR